MASHFLIFLFFTLTSNYVSGGLVLEDGYTVTTVLDGNKLNINPHSVLPRSGSSDLILLDSSGNTFYTVSFPISQDSVITRFSGNGTDGFSDGDSASAMFSKPRSFAVDSQGNVYVADKKNLAIRKISKSGVTTIAGGYSHKIGKIDGPAQNASFSDDLELAFVPEKCVLLICDHGNKLVRQINLKLEDCARGSRSALGAASIWILGLGVSCLLGLIIGFTAHPYIVPNTGRLQPSLSQRDMEALPNQSGETNTDTLLRIQKHSQIPRMESVSLLDSDNLCSREILQSQMFTDQLKDLISLDGSLELSDTNKIFRQADENQERSNVLSESRGRIDNMIQANIMGFEDAAKGTIPLDGTLLGNSGLVKRR